MKNELPTYGRALRRGPVSLLALSLVTPLLTAQQSPDPSHAHATCVAPSPEESVSAVDAARFLEHAVDPLVPIHTAAPDMGVPYGVWGAGPGYKISFHDGATFVPVLGEEYPHNQPWRWQTTSVTVGGQELATQAPRLSYEGSVASYDLGAVVERYELRRDGVEQTFVLPRRSGGGDLVVRGAVASQLQAAAAAAAHQALRFHDAAGRHLFTYGAAVAVDARGRQQAMTTSHENGEITLRLDGGWLETAAYPVVVDPLLGVGTQLQGSVRSEVDVVRDSEGAVNSVWIAYSIVVSASDEDVYLRRFDDDGQVGPQVFFDATSNWSTRGPRCAYVAGANRVIVTFDRTLANDTRVMRYHTHDRTDTTSNTLVWGISTSDNAWRGDVGGTVLNGSGTEALVVWQQEPNGGAFAETPSSDVYGCFVDVAANSAGVPFAIANSALTDNERPSVNQCSSGSAANTWLVAYQTLTTLAIGGTDDWDIGVREVDLSGAVSAPVWVDNSSSDHKLAPTIEGSGGRYLVAFVASPNVGAPVPSGANGHQLRVTRLDWAQGSGVGTQPHGSNTLASYNDARVTVSGLGYDRATQSHWLLGWHSSVTEAIYVRSVGFTGSYLDGELLINPPDTSARGGISFDATGPQFVVAYGANTTMTGYVAMDRFVLPAAPSSVTAGAACSPATIQWLGAQQIGSQFSGPRVTGSAIDAIHLMVAALAPASFQLFGIAPIQDGCWLLVPSAGPDFLGIMDLRVGAVAEWNLPLPEFLDSMTLYFQDFHTVGGGVLEFVSTQRLEVPIVK